MRVIIEENNERTIIQIQEYVHYANVAQNLGTSTWEAISQDAVTKALTDSKLKNIYIVPDNLDVEDLSDLGDSDDYFQQYLNYLQSVEEDESNRYADIEIDPTYQEYLNYIGVGLAPVNIDIPEFPVIESVINETALGYLLISPKDLNIKPGLPVGFNFTIISRTQESIKINIPSEEMLWSPEGLINYLDVMDEIRLIKITETEWLRSDLLRMRFIN